MIPVIITIIPLFINLTDLNNQLKVFNQESAGFSFYNYSFMNYENLDWINNALNILKDN